MLSILPALLLLLLNGTSSCDHLVAADGARHVVNAGLSLREVCDALASHVLVAAADETQAENACKVGMQPREVRASIAASPAATLRRIAQETSRDRDGPASA